MKQLRKMRDTTPLSLSSIFQCLPISDNKKREEEDGQREWRKAIRARKSTKFTRVIH